MSDGVHIQFHFIKNKLTDTYVYRHKHNYIPCSMFTITNSKHTTRNIVVFVTIYICIIQPVLVIRQHNGDYTPQNSFH